MTKKERKKERNKYLVSIPPLEVQNKQKKYLCAILPTLVLFMIILYLAKLKFFQHCIMKFLNTEENKK